MKCPQGLLLHQSGSLNALGWSQVENGYELRCFYLYTHLCVQEINSVCFVSYFAILKFDHHNLALRNNADAITDNVLQPGASQLLLRTSTDKT